MGEASEMSSVSEGSTADTGKAGGGAEGGKAKILVPVVVLLVVLSVVGAMMITGGQDDPNSKSSAAGGDSEPPSSPPGNPPSDEPTRPPVFSGPNKVLFCFIGDKEHPIAGEDEPDSFPNDNVCTHLILGCAELVKANSNFDVLDPPCQSAFKKMTKHLEDRYKKTEGGLSVKRSTIGTENAGTVVGDGLNEYVRKKFIHFGMHEYLAEFTEEEFKSNYLPYLKSIYDGQKKINPDRMGDEAPDPLYGFVGFQLRPYKTPQDVADAAQKMEDLLGFRVLFIIHVNFEMPNVDTECVYGGTPLNLPQSCEKPSFMDYVQIEDKVAFKKGSKVAAMFDMAVVRTELSQADPIPKKFSEMKKPRDIKSSLKPIGAACNGDPVTTEAANAAIAGKVEGKTVYAYDDVNTWESKLSKFYGKTVKNHLGYAVNRVEYDAEVCDQQRPFNRLAKFQQASRIKRQ